LLIFSKCYILVFSLRDFKNNKTHKIIIVTKPIPKTPISLDDELSTIMLIAVVNN